MERQLEQDLEHLKAVLQRMAAFVESSVADALGSLLDRSAERSAVVLQGDGQIDSLELEIDNLVLDLLALRQPVASDLRFILAAQKINNDLERIGDHAVNVAQSARASAGRAERRDLLDLPAMTEIAKSMLRDALRSFFELDPTLARSVILEDDRMDERNRTLCSRVIEMIREDHAALEWGLDLIRVSRNLERISDLATNIAEEAIFLTQARLVKHHGGQTL